MISRKIWLTGKSWNFHSVFCLCLFSWSLGEIFIVAHFFLQKILNVLIFSFLLFRMDLWIKNWPVSGPSLAENCKMWPYFWSIEEKFQEKKMVILNACSTIWPHFPSFRRLGKNLVFYNNLSVVFSQCGNFIKFLSLRFYVKSILENLEVLKMPFLPF